jgi:hypothetical protein
MRRAIGFLGLGLVIYLCPAAIEASEVVEFTDGRYLEIRSHVVDGAFMRLELADDSLLIFPRTQVDSIRSDWTPVYSRHDDVDRSDRATPAEASQTTRALASARRRVS